MYIKKYLKMSLEEQKQELQNISSESDLIIEALIKYYGVPEDMVETLLQHITNITFLQYLKFDEIRK